MNVLKIVLATAIISIAGTSQAQEIKPIEVKNVMKQVADWQIDHFRDNITNGLKKLEINMNGNCIIVNIMQMITL